jgi:hypothetical protein
LTTARLRTVDGLAARGHVIVVLDDGRAVFVRQVVDGTVTYVAPGVSGDMGETPGQTARRAAHVHLGIDVEIADLVYADTENGADHFYFLASPLDSLERRWVEQETMEGALTTSIAPLHRSALLAYPIRPSGVGRRLRTAPLQAR